MNPSGLGKGLSALIPKRIKEDLILSASKNTPAEKEEPVKNESGEKQKLVREVAISRIEPNINQPRKNFEEDSLKNLADSIKEYGVLQPIVITPEKNGKHQIIAGERRFRAASLAKLEKIPVVIKEAGTLEKIELALVENIQRKDLNPIEEARAYASLIKDFGVTQEIISQKVRKGRSSISNLLRLLKLPLEIQQGLIEGKISEGHAKIIAALENHKAQLMLYRKTIKDSLTVKDVEDETRRMVSVKSHQRILKGNPSPAIAQKEKIIADYFGLKVSIKPKKRGGKILMEYYDNNDLLRVIQLLEEESL